MSEVFQCTGGKIPIEHVLDPTFLLEKKNWQKFIVSKVQKERYILVFIFMNDKKAVSVAKELSEKMDRMLSLLFLLGLEDRVYDNELKCPGVIDYKIVMQKLARARKKSFEFLKTAIKGEEA